MKRLLVVALVTLSLVGCAVQAAPPWEGVYRVDGINPNGSTYTGAAQIVRIPGTELYQIGWILDGQPDDLFMTAVGFVFEDRLIAGGLQSPLPMAFNRNGDGRWATPGDTSKIGHERLTRTEFKTLPEAVKPVAPKPPAAPAAGLRL